MHASSTHIRLSHTRRLAYSYCPFGLLNDCLVETPLPNGLAPCPELILTYLGHMFDVFRLGDSCPANYYVSSISFIDSPDTAFSRMSLQSRSLFTLQASEGTSPSSMLYFLFIIYGRYTHQKLVLSPFIQL